MTVEGLIAYLEQWPEEYHVLVPSIRSTDTDTVWVPVDTVFTYTGDSKVRLASDEEWY